MNPWGQLVQPKSVFAWQFPVTLRDMGSGEAQPVQVVKTLKLLKKTRFGLRYPVAFSMHFASEVHCIEVSDKLAQNTKLK